MKRAASSWVLASSFVLALVAVVMAARARCVGDTCCVGSHVTSRMADARPTDGVSCLSALSGPACRRTPPHLRRLSRGGVRMPTLSRESERLAGEVLRGEAGLIRVARTESDVQSIESSAGDWRLAEVREVCKLQLAPRVISVCRT
jgi:hypothetical protein